MPSYGAFITKVGIKFMAPFTGQLFISLEPIVKTEKMKFWKLIIYQYLSIMCVDYFRIHVDLLVHAKLQDLISNIKNTLKIFTTLYSLKSILNSSVWILHKVVQFYFVYAHSYTTNLIDFARLVRYFRWAVILLVYMLTLVWMIQMAWIFINKAAGLTR